MYLSYCGVGNRRVTVNSVAQYWSLLFRLPYNITIFMIWELDTKEPIKAGIFNNNIAWITRFFLRNLILILLCENPWATVVIRVKQIRGSKYIVFPQILFFFFVINNTSNKTSVNSSICAYDVLKYVPTLYLILIFFNCFAHGHIIYLMSYNSWPSPIKNKNIS